MRRSALLTLALVSSCAAPAYVAGLRKPTPPLTWAEHREDRLTSKDGQALLYQSWRPRGVEPKAVVVIVHGLKDHSDRYAGFAQKLVEAGYAVHALDLRGHGDSTGDRVWVDDFDDYLDDVDAALAEVRKVEGEKKLFLFGHSMGGAVVTLHTLTRTPAPAGLITSAGALGISESGFTQGITKVFAALFPTLAIFSLDDEKFSRDPQVIADMKADPLIYDKAAPARTAVQVIHAVDSIRERAATLEVPVLALHGTADGITPPSGSAALISAASSKDKTLKSYEGFFHDLLHEPGGAQVVTDIIGWLDAH